MMRRFVKTVSAVLAGCAALVSLSAAANAQEIQITGPLAGAPAVRQLRLHRDGRFEVSVGTSFTLLDQYLRTTMPGGTLTYHFTDWLGIGVFGGYGIQTTTGLTDNIQSSAITAYNCASRPWTQPCQLTAVNLTHGNLASDQLAHMTWMLAPQVVGVPFRGKIALFNAAFILDTDVSFFLGAAFTGLKERGNCGEPNPSGTGFANGEVSCSDQKSFALQNRMAIAPTFGMGLNFYPAWQQTNFFGVGFEFRAFPFSWNTSGFDVGGGGPGKAFPDGIVNSDNRQFHFNTMITIQLKFAFPVTIKKSP